MQKNPHKLGAGPKGSAWPLLALATLSGATALGHQLLWTRRMIDLLGAGAESQARVFGVFFLGLALGSAAAALVQPRLQRPWRFLAWMDLGTAFLAVPMLLLPVWSDGLWLWLGPEALESWKGAAFRTLLSALLVFPSATLMGFFVPIAIPAWPASRRGRGDWGVRLYAVNTLGAVLGVLLTAGLLIQHLGVFGAMLVAMLGNAAVAGGCFWFDLRLRPARPEVARLDVPPPEKLRPEWLWVACASGFLVLAAEVVSLQMLQLTAPLSFHAPAAILATVILTLALGAFVVEYWSLNHRMTPAHLGAAACVAAVALALVPLLFLGLAKNVQLFRDGVSLFRFQLRLVLFTMAAVGPAFLIAGIVFPMVTVLADAGSGRRWGWLLAVNGVGGLMGAEIAYRLLLPAFGPHTALGALSLAYILIGWQFLSSRPRAARWVLIGLSVLLAWLFAYVHPALPRVNPGLRPLVVAEYHGREGSLAILEGAGFGRSMLVANQYTLGTTAAGRLQERQAHIPLLLHPAARQVAFIGIATGMTPGAALLHPRTEEITAIELSRTVAEAAETWFSAENRGIMNHPRAHIVIDDGRTWIAACNERFDLIVADLFLPWGQGEARLYSREHFAAVRRALRPDGLFCQWLPMYQLTEEQFHSIATTLLEVFPAIEVVLCEADDTVQPVLGLLASPDDAWAWPTDLPPFHVEIEASDDPLLRDPALLHALHLGRFERGDLAGRVNTLDNLAVELDAGRMRITRPDSAPYLSGPRWEAWRTRFFAPSRNR